MHKNTMPNGALIRVGLIFRILALAVLLAGWSAACRTPFKIHTQTITPTITTTPTSILACPTLNPTETPFQYPPQIATDTPPPWNNPFNNWQGVAVYALFLGNQGNVGAEQNFIIESVPAFLQTAPSLTWVQPWADHNVARMRSCLSFDTPCTPDGPWIPFGVSSDSMFPGGFRQNVKFTLDWIGRRTVWIGVQYRDTLGSPVAAVDGDYNLTVNPGPQEILQMNREVAGVWNRNLPLTEHPPAVQTVIAVTQMAYPVTGLVDIGPGRGVVGGTAGETLQMDVVFIASSPNGVVTGMRTGGCSMDAVEGADWEPYVALKTYPVHVPINWSTFEIGVQYRDDKGYLSQVYCDDVAVEGMPVMPTPFPTEWYSQIACFTENEVRPGPGEKIGCENVLFMWPATNNLTQGIFYEVNVLDAKTGTHIASSITSETSIAIRIPPEYAGELVWYVSLRTDTFGAIDHNRCSSTIPASLVTSHNYYVGLEGIHFWYRP